MEEKRNTKFVKKVWLNKEDSPSTGNIVAYDGMVYNIDNTFVPTTFFRVSDCHVSANIHKAVYDTDEEFIEKMQKIRNTLNEFIAYLIDTKIKH